MFICKSGRVIKKRKNGVETYYIRLNLIDNDKVGRDKYRAKDIDTGLKATVRNRSKANALVEYEVSKYAQIGDEMLFSAYCQQWLERKKAEVELTTYEGYEYRVGHIIKYFTTHPVKLGSLTADDVDRFYRYLLTKEKDSPTQRDNVGLSNRTIKDIASLLRTILSDSLMLGHQKDKDRIELIINVKAPKKPKTHSSDAYIGIDELNIFKKAIRGHRLGVPFLFTLYYGLRREETAGLKWSAIRNNRLYIEHTVTRLKTSVAKDRTKTDASYRDYPIPPDFLEMLRKIKEKQDQNRALMGNSYHDSDYIFTWEDGRPYSTDYYTKSFKKLVRKTEGLDNNLHLHSLRGSCISIMIHNGVDVKDVQSWVGHEDIQTTLGIYAKSNRKQQNRVMDCMNNIILNEGSSEPNVDEPNNGN